MDPDAPSALGRPARGPCRRRRCPDAGARSGPPAAAAVLAAASLSLALACGPASEAPSAGGEAAAGGEPAWEETARALFTGEGGERVDMTHPFDERAIYWPTQTPFRLDTVAADSTGAGYWYAAFEYGAAEHGGTHMDAPFHFARAGATADEVSLDRLVGPAAVVDVSAAADTNPDYRVRVEDLRAWEEEHGRIPDGAIVLLDTGWGARWPDREAILGTDLTGQEAVPHLHFPGLHPDAARWLVEERSPAAVGLDTPSIDYGQSEAFRSHRILYEAGVPGFENVARMDELPATGAYVVALPMKIAGGSGAPLRIVGVVPREAG